MSDDSVDTRDLPFVREINVGPPSRWERLSWPVENWIEEHFPRIIVQAWQRFFVLRRESVWLYERIRYGISIRDGYEFPEHMSRIIARGVRHIRSEGHGNPMGIPFEEWQAIMLEIAEGFELIAADNIPRSNVEKAKIERGKTLFAEWFEHLWD